METIETLQKKIDQCKARISDLRQHQMMSDGSQARHEYSAKITAEQKVMAGYVDQLVKIQVLQDDAPDFDFADDVPEFFEVLEFEEVPHFSNQFKDPGFYYGISNDEYRASEAISKSDLDYIEVNPAQFIWAKNAPIDSEKLEALDNGSALHCLMLEPEQFEKRFIVMPEFNGRTNQGKADKAAWLEEVKDCGQIILEPEYARKLPIMRESLLAHPLVRDIFESEYDTEVSGYFKDPETGLLVKFRPDLMLKNAPMLCDLKKLAQFDRMDYVFEDHRYHVQNALYADGYKQITGEYPVFVFIAVSDAVNCGRYEVDVIQLDEDHDDRNKISIASGREIYKSNLRKYAGLLEQNSTDAWKTTRTLKTRRWR